MCMAIGHLIGVVKRRNKKNYPSLKKIRSYMAICIIVQNLVPGDSIFLKSIRVYHPHRNVNQFIHVYVLYYVYIMWCV